MGREAKGQLHPPEPLDISAIETEEWRDSVIAMVKGPATPSWVRNADIDDLDGKLLITFDHVIRWIRAVYCGGPPKRDDGGDVGEIIPRVTLGTYGPKIRNPSWSSAYMESGNIYIEWPSKGSVGRNTLMYVLPWYASEMAAQSMMKLGIDGVVSQGGYICIKQPCDIMYSLSGSLRAVNAPQYADKLIRVIENFVSSGTHPDIGRLLSAYSRINGSKILCAANESMDYISVEENTGMITYLPAGKADAFPWSTTKRQSVKAGRFIRMLYEQEWIDYLGVKDTDIEAFANSVYAHFNFDADISLVTGNIIKHWYHQRNYEPSIRVLNGSCMRGSERQDSLGLYTDNPKQVGMIVAVNKNQKLVGRALVWTKDDGTQYLDRVYSDDKGTKAIKEWAKKRGIIDMREGKHPDAFFTMENPWHFKYPYIDTMQYIDPKGTVYRGDNRTANTISMYDYNKSVRLRPTECAYCHEAFFASSLRIVGGSHACFECYKRVRAERERAELDEAIKENSVRISDSSIYDWIEAGLIAHISTLAGDRKVYAINHINDRWIVRNMNNKYFSQVTSDELQALHARSQALIPLIDNIYRGKPMPETVTFDDIDDLGRLNVAYVFISGDGPNRVASIEYSSSDSSTRVRISVGQNSPYTIESLVYDRRRGRYCTEEEMRKENAARIARLEKQVNEAAAQSGSIFLPKDGERITFTWSDSSGSLIAERG